MKEKFRSPLHEMASTTVTDYWNDSCSVKELTYAIANGAVGATSNPSIVLNVVRQEMEFWSERIKQMISDNPSWSEVEITWKIFEEVAVKGAQLLQPVFERHQGKKGRLSIQTNPQNYRNADALVAQALRFDTLAPNMQVKIPATAAGIKAIEEATFQGVNINATVCFSVPQSIAVAEAVERGLNRRGAEGKDIASMTPVCTIMVGRLDDWIQVLAKRDDIITHPAYPHWAGIAAIKKAYQIYQQRGYRARLLAAAYRHHLHWSELIGGDIILTIPYEWQLQFNASDIEVREHFLEPVSAQIIGELRKKFPDFNRAYNEDGMAVEAFDCFGPTVRTLRTFTSAYHDLQGLIRDFMLPNPDIRT